MMDSIVDYRKSDKVLSVSSQKMVYRGRSFMRISTLGWQICVQWIYGSTLCKSLKYLNEYITLDIVEYAVAKETDNRPELNWWVKALLNKISRILYVVKTINAQYLKKTHKFGIGVPKSLAQAYALDKKNSNTLWEYFIAN